MNTQLQLNRIDYGIKHKYAHQFITLNKTSNYTRRTYLSHLRTWNSFIEDNKRSKTDFIDQFESVIKGISANGYESFPPIQVTSEQNLVNGIHRLVTCDLVGIDPDIQYVRSQYKYDSKFFESYQNPHDGSHFSLQLRNNLIRSYIDSVSVNALVVLPRAIAIDGGKFVKNMLRNDNKVALLRRFRVPLNLLDLLVTHFYYDQNWCNPGSQINWEAIAFKRKEITSPDTQQYVDFYATTYTANDLAEIKKEIRSFYGIENSSVHSTDHPKDARIVGQFLMSTNALKALWSTNRCRNGWVINNYLIKELTSSSYEWNPDRMLVGSALNDIAGLRQANDLDFLSRESDLSCKHNASHNEYDYLYSRPIFDLIDEPSCYFTLFGAKVISATEYKSFKRQRNEEKDLQDLYALNSVGI